MSTAAEEARRRESLARTACVIGGVFDGLMLVPMLAPSLGASLLRLPHFAPGADYRYAMSVAASLMLGWTLLLFWAARRPAERAAVLLLTAVVVGGLMVAGGVAVASGFVALPSMVPMFVTQLGLAGLFWVAWHRVRADWPATDPASEEQISHLFWYPGHELLLSDIVRAENCDLYDSAGKRYVDLESGVWCASIGHGHPRVLRVLAEQPARIAHTGFCYSSGIVEEAAHDVLSLLGFDGGSCVFLCSGSDAVEYGVRVAQAVADQPLLMTMADSYFGAYGSAARKREDEWFCFDWMRCGEAGGCREGCPHWAEIPFDRIGGFLFEPGSSSGLVRFPARGLIEAIVRAVGERGGLILVNEVTTGIGRTGEWFGHQHYRFTPDIVAMGKGIGAGYPVSVTAFAPRAVDRLRGGAVKFAQSHQNDPLGAAVVSEVIRVIQEEGLIERGRQIGDFLRSGLESIRRRTGRISEVRGRGLMLALELEDDPESTRTIRVHRELVRRGFVVGRRPGVNVLRLDPSLTIERRDVEGFLQALEEILIQA